MVCRVIYKVLITLLICFIWVGECFSSPTQILVTDKLGRKITVSVPVKRAIIAITPELIPALNLWNQVVGVSDWAERYCGVYRAFVLGGLKKKKPTVGTGISLNIERILKLKPDIVITWSYNTKVIKFLENEGIKVIAIWPDTLSELYQVIRLYGKLFGKEKRAEEVINEMNKMFNFIKSRVSTVPSYKKKKILHLEDKPTTVLGRIGVTNDIIKIIGGINVAENINARYARVSIERIIKWNPDVIFIWGYAGYNESWLYNNSQWRFVKAVKNHQVYKLPHWSSWSPRLAIIALYMAMKVYPEQFKDVNFEKIVDSFYKKVFGISYYVVKSYEKY